LEIRLQKWLSQAGVASRRKAEELILSGQVAINGVTVTELGARAHTDKDKVTVNGQPCNVKIEKIYIALHKPEGVVTTVSDQFNRPTVMDYIPGEFSCYPVGRLDYDTSGLLLLTNDGDFAQQMTHPKHETVKTYIAKIKGRPAHNALENFRCGVIIDGRRTAPAEIEIIQKAPHGSRKEATGFANTKEPNTIVSIKLREGRNRQVRKMCEAIGHRVLTLKRVGIGSIKLEGLPKGQWRLLTADEIQECIADCD